MPEGSLVMVLHSHLPYVLGQGAWPHGESWLYEAAAETYLPLLLECERLAEDGIRPAFTIEFSPVLGEQLDDPRFQHGFAGYLDTLTEAAIADQRSFSDQGRREMAALARGWRDRFRFLAEAFRDRGGDLLGGFARLADRGQLELATCARTHGLLPLLGHPERVEAQVRQGAAWFRERFGRPPRGIWMPECGYRPTGPWEPVAPGPAPEESRPGNEEYLVAAGFRWTVVDTHLVAGGDPLGSYPAKEAQVGEERSPHRVYDIGGSGLRALPRDPATTLQVWSGEWGYPGNPWYLEFHKKHSEGGLRYWRVSEKGTDLGEKRLYEPYRISGIIEEQAEHFAGLVGSLVEDGEVVCSPYDTELFGHWWAEGVDWLAAARRRLHQRDVPMATASEAIERTEPIPINLPAGSWGDQGDFRVWDNDQTTWMWQEIYRAERLLRQARDDAGRSASAADALQQLERSVALVEASDWPFLVTTGGAADYAAQRVSRHAEDVTRLSLLVRELAAGRRPPEELANLLANLQEREPLWTDPS